MLSIKTGDKSYSILHLQERILKLIGQAALAAERSFTEGKSPKGRASFRAARVPGNVPKKIFLPYLILYCLFSPFKYDKQMKNPGFKKDQKLCKLLLVFLIMFFLGIIPIYAQTPLSTGYRLYEIETEHYRVIFPSELTGDAQKVANTLEYLHDFQRGTLHPKREFKYSVILSPKGSANGYVATSPRRSVFFNYPGEYSANDWLTLLCVHEGRHLTQFNTLDQSTTTFLSFLLGDYGFAPALATASSRLLEGDAVTTETILSNSGRGRSPEFTMLMKALLVEENEPNFFTINHGSYKQELPNQYVFGYLMSVYMRRIYGKEITNQMLSESAKYPIPVLWAVKKIKHNSQDSDQDSGNGDQNVEDADNDNQNNEDDIKPKRLNTIYNEMCDELRPFYNKQISQINETPVDLVSSPLPSSISKRNSRRPGFREYKFPHPSRNGVIVFKRTLNSYKTGIYLIEENSKTTKQTKTVNEKKIREISSINSLSVKSSKIAWAEKRTDISFADLIFSDIYIHDILTDHGKKITKDGYYFLPTLSSDGETVIAINRNPSPTESGAIKHDEINLFNTTSGELINTIDLPIKGTAGKAIFSSDDSEITLIITNVGKKEIYTYNLASSEWRLRLKVNGEFIRHLAPINDSILFSSNYSGIDNIYILNPDNSRQRITSRKYGAFHPQFDQENNRIIFSDFTASNGYNIVAIPLSQLKRESLATIAVLREDFFVPILDQEPGAFALQEEKIPQKYYPVTHYNRVGKLFNLHSWAPVDPDTFMDDLPTPRVGFFGYSNDLFMTTSQDMGIFYDFSANGIGTSYSFKYQGIKPNIILQGETLFLQNQDFSNGGEIDRNYTAAGLALELPFAYTWNTESLALSAKIGSSVTGTILSDMTVSSEEAAQTAITALPLSYYGSFFIGKHFRSDGDFDTTFPLSFSATTRYTHEPVNTKRGTSFSLASNQNLPGIIPGATFQFGETYTMQNRSSSSAPCIRGSLTGNSYESLLFSGEYTFTIFNPNLPFLGLIASWNRLRGGIFYNNQIILKENQYDTSPVTRDDLYQSVGAEVLFDLTFLEAGYDFSIGIEFSWLIEEERPVFRVMIEEIAIY